MNCIVKIYFVTSKMKYNTYSIVHESYQSVSSRLHCTGTQARDLHGSKVLYYSEINAKLLA